jgi:GntR family transcriptional regulator
VEKKKASRRNAGGNAKRRPQYENAAQALAEIIAGTSPGEHLPSEPKLSRRLGVSRATLREAMRLFEERGLVIRRQGVGTVVTDAPRIIKSGLEVLESLETMAARMGMLVEMGEHEIEARPALDSEADLFGIPPADQVLEIRRAMLTDGQPVAYLVDVLPEGLLPRRWLAERFAGSILDLLLERGQPSLSHARTEITAIPAPDEVARALNIESGDVLQWFKGSIFDEDGLVVNRSESYFLPLAFRFHVVRRFDGVMSAISKNRKVTGAQP